MKKKSPRFPWLSAWLEKRAGKTVPLVRLAGVIGTGSLLRPGLSLTTLNDTLERAFAKKGVAAVAIVINSPGGSPVQSSLIHDRIRQLAEKNQTRVIVFCEDVAASGGYWLAVAGDEIHADACSIIGSIGVIAASFGFVEAIGRLGIDRRIYTAGENKSFLDPFSPENPDDVERLKSIQLEVHEAFKQKVRDRRKDHLTEDAPDLFTGAFWTGQRALELGLIDGIGHPHAVLRQKFGSDVKIKPVGKPGNFLTRRLSALTQSPATALENLLDGLQIRAIWDRFGLG